MREGIGELHPADRPELRSRAGTVKQRRADTEDPEPYHSAMLSMRRFLLLWVLGSLLTPAAGLADRIVVGEPFPGLSFPALGGGEPRSIHDFRGTKLIAHVFASW